MRLFSPLWQTFKKYNSLSIHIANKNNFIQARCYEGRKNGTVCRQMYNDTELWAILEPFGIKCVYVPSMICHNHKRNNITRLYGWKNEKEEFVKGFGDEVINYYPIWTATKFPTKRKQSRGYWTSRYHFSDDAFEMFTDCIMINSSDVYLMCIDGVCLIYIDGAYLMYI